MCAGQFLVEASPASLLPHLVTIPGASGLHHVDVYTPDGGDPVAAANYWAGVVWTFYYADGTHATAKSLPWLLGLYPWCHFTKDPVNTSTGNATYSSTDLSLAGKGAGLALTRTYNSQDTSTSAPLGWGWTLGYSAHLESPAASQVTLVAADGRREVFTASSGGDYTPPQEGVTERLHKNTDGTFTLTSLDESREEFDSTGRLTSLADRYGNATTLTYDSGGLLTQVAAAGGRNLTLTYLNGLVTQATDSAGRTVSYTYDAQGNLVSVTDPNGHTTTYAYDAAHEVTSISLPKASASPFMTNTYTDGKVTLQTDALGDQTALAYDGTAQKTTITDARGHASVDTWDASFRLTSQLDPLGYAGSITYNSAGFPATTTDKNGHTSTYAYDSLGNVVSATDPEGHQTTASYDATNGNSLSSTDAGGNQTTYAWDPTGIFLNSVTSPIGTTSFTWNPDGTLASQTDAKSHTSQFAYDASGDLTSATDPAGNATTYEYDSAGRNTAVVDANASRTEFVYSPKGNVTSMKDPLAQTDPANRHQMDFTYDANDNVTQITDARGGATSFAYDDMNHLNLVTDALLGTAHYTYDPTYNLTSAQDPNGHSTTFAYDADNRLTSSSDALGRQTAYAHDPVGNLISVTHPSGDTASFTYTPDDLVSGTSHSSDSTTYSYSYNPTNTLAKVEKNNGGKAWTFTYDAADRLKAETDKNDPTLGKLAIKRKYDKVFDLTGLDIGDLFSLDFTYNARDFITSLTGPGGTTTFNHDPVGRLTKVVTPDASEEHFVYDATGRLTKVKNITASGTQVFKYTYDGDGDILSENSTAYTYDALSRLTSWYDPASHKTTTYAYDPAGNLTQVQKDGTTTQSYTYDAGNEITNPGYTYDANGNLTAAGTRKYLYDADNQLVKVKEGKIVLATMTYDYAGRRTSLATATGTTYFHYDGKQLVAESDGSGALTATYAHTPDGRLVSMTRGGQTYYYQTNAHGDVVSLTDSAGTIVNSYAYDPWGIALATNETVQNPFRYASYYYDTSAQLYYIWHRYYDPALGRFLSADAVPPPAGLTQAMNRYAYALDAPPKFIDLFGALPTLVNVADDLVPYCAQKTTDPNVSLGAKIGYGLEGLFYSLFTSDNAGTTLNVACAVGGFFPESDGVPMYRRGMFPPEDPADPFPGNEPLGKQWAPEDPLTTPDFPKKYGLPLRNSGFPPDWVVQATPGGPCDTGPAEPSWDNPENTGGAQELRPQDPSKIRFNWFHMP